MLKYKQYFDFSGGFNDTTEQDLLKDNELLVCENVEIKKKGELNIRQGTEKINEVSREANITRRFEYLIRDTSIIMEVYDKKLYKDDILIQALNSDKPYFLQQQDVLYICDGNEIYELGNKDYFSNIGTVDIKKDDIVQIADDFTTENLRGKFYKALSDLGSVDLSAEDYTVAENWQNVTDILGATSNVIRPLKSYQAGEKEIVKISVFGSVTKSGYITVTLNETEYDINVTSGNSSWQVATAIKNTVFTGYTTTSSQNIATLTANEIGYKEDCYVEPYDTGVSLVVATEVNGEDNDNILDEVKKCTKFIQHSKSGRYVATGNPKKPYTVYFSEPFQLNYFKQFNVLIPTSSEGSPVCMLNLLDSVLVGYKHSWYEYTGIEPSTDGQWKRLAIPYGCVAEYSVQVLDLYSFIYLSDNGLYQVSANVLSQNYIVMSNSTAVKNISDDKVSNTIKGITDKSKCVSVYHYGIYYLAFDTKILLYYTDKKAFTLFTNIQVNDFLYRKNGILEMASLNYSLKFAERYLDVDVLTGEDKRIEFEVKTTNLTLDDNIAEKFIDKLFIQAKTGSLTNEPVFKTIIKVDFVNVDIIEMIEADDGLVWGTEWGNPWGNYSTTMQSVFIREKGNRVELTFTNKGLTDNGIETIIYGFALSYRPLIPYQGFSNLSFNG